MATKLLYAAVVIVALILGFKYWGLQYAYNAIYKTEPHGNSIGPVDAEKVLIEFFDYKCEYCREMHPRMMAFHEKHPDVKIIFRPFPILGKPSIDYADLALSAGLQGEFLSVHKMLFEEFTPEEFDDALVTRTAERFNLDEATIRSTFKGAENGEALLDTFDASSVLNINSVPAFVAGKVVFVPSGELPTIEDLERLMAEAYPEQ